VSLALARVFGASATGAKGTRYTSWMTQTHASGFLRGLASILWACLLALGAAPGPAAAQGARTQLAGCLLSGNGYLRAKVQGSLDFSIDWRDAEMECDGSARPDGSGLRLSFAGPASDGRRVRLVFGVARATEGKDGGALPTNVTVIFEGEKRVFATRGDDKCTTDKLQQERVGALGGHARSYRAVGRGFCTGPASSLDGTSRIVLTSFDFAGSLNFDDSLLDLASFPKTDVVVKSAKGPQRFHVWIARAPREQEQGLMFVHDLPADKGMLFIENPPRQMRMWMKNTFVELDMLFIGSDGRIRTIVERTVPHSLETLGPAEPVAAVLEIKGGEAALRGLEAGDLVSWKTP